MNHTHRILTLATLAAVASGALAAPFTPGNIVISRIGDGSAALTNAATAVFLDEYTTAGVFVQTVAVPTADSGANQTVTNSGSATSEGFVRRSQNGAYLMVVGYDAPLGTASVATSLSATFNRVVARVAADGTIDSTTAFDAYSAGNIRSASSLDGTAFWVAGTGTGTGAAATGGSRYIPFGAAQTSVLLSESPTNVRANLIFGGQLYISSNSGSFRGVSTVGTGLPINTGNTTTLLAGFDPLATPSPYDFAFADANTLYIADDRALASGGGVQRWGFNGTAWQLQYTITAGLTGTNGPRSIVVVPQTSGSHVVYATTGESNANSLATMIDNGPASNFVVLATAPINTRFRGLEFSPVQAQQTIVPNEVTIGLGQITGGDVSSLSATDGNSLRVCRFVVPFAGSPYARVNVFANNTGLTTISAGTIELRDRSATAGLFRRTLLGVLSGGTGAARDTLVTNGFPTSFADYSLTLTAGTGALADYLGTNGRLGARIEVLQTGPSASLTPCSEFDKLNWVVTP